MLVAVEIMSLNLKVAASGLTVRGGEEQEEKVQERERGRGRGKKERSW